ncbi:MFS transporter [Paenibacillus tepidiphilus]|uniref:MFS transporter n=1 Tax=Paenibacillus tepidiphilus TaxID=2608683 RepID=UPI001EEFB73C|nr:MFS transporter [Paenibacillus tepidiphilus]
MFNIALVDISADLGIPVSSAQWVVSIYLLVISVLLPVMGRLGDIRSRRRVHNAGLFTFALGALGCALAGNAAMLLFFRVIQGIGASMYQATNMALIVSVFPQEQRGRALGLMSTFVAAGSMAGPGLGGFLIQWFAWESNFWLLAAIAAVVAVLAQRWIPRDTEVSGGRLDLGAALWFAVCLSTLMVAVDLGGRTSFASLPVLLLFAASAATAAAYAAKQRHARRGGGAAASAAAGGLLFAGRYVAIGIVITVVTYMAAFAAQLALPAVLRMAGAEPAWVGLIMIGYPLALVVTAPLGGSLADRKGPLGILAAGLTLMSVTLLALGLAAPALGAAGIALPVVLLGCAMGMITSPNTSIVMGMAPKEQLGMVSSVLALFRNIGMMFGTAAGGLVIGGESAGRGGSYAAVFLVCAACVGLACLWLLQTFRGSGRKRLRESAR